MPLPDLPYLAGIASAAPALFARIMDLVITDLGANCAAVVAARRDEFVVLAQQPNSLRTARTFVAEALARSIRRNRTFSINLRTYTDHLPPFLAAGDLGGAFCIRLACSNPDTSFAVVVGFRKSASIALSAAKEHRAYSLCEVLSDHITVLLDVAGMMDEYTELRNRVREPQASFAGSMGHNDLDIATRFLAETIVRKRSLLSRNGVTWHALNQWRKPIKEFQISAVRLLKRTPESPLVQVIASDMHDWITGTFGKGAFDAVVPMPCGHSGPDCLSRRLGVALAGRIKTPRIDAIAPL